MRKASYWVAAMALTAAVGPGYPGPLEEWENRQMGRLAAIQADPQGRRAGFTTDGCSGGMSGAWLSCATVFGTRVPVRLGLATCGKYWIFESLLRHLSQVVSGAPEPSPRWATAMRYSLQENYVGAGLLFLGK